MSKAMVDAQLIHEKLSQIIDPDLKLDIVAAGFVKDIYIKLPKIRLRLELTTPACPVKDDFKKQAESILLELPGVESVEVTLSAMEKKRFIGADKSGLADVKTIFAVASCKGGVGKSTVAALLASQLAYQGHKVGLLDIDIFGPSVPTLFKLKYNALAMQKNMIMPLEVSLAANSAEKNLVKQKLKLMSFGFLLGDAPAVMRGPMVSNYVQQGIHRVDWGLLEYLIIDLPPGTGDTLLSLGQSVQLDAALMISTPAELSLVDVSRGIIAFEKLKIPMLGIVENMAFFTCCNCGKDQQLFGKSAALLKERFGLDLLCRLPFLDPSKGLSFSPFHPSAFSKSLVENTIRAYGRHLKNKEELPKLYFDSEKITITWSGEPPKTIKNNLLRSHCPCAQCKDEYTGVTKIQKETLQKNIMPLRIEPLGLYSILIHWNDGHHSGIYPYALLKQL